jgi:hypothetical protein
VEVVLVQRRRGRVVEDDEVGGSPGLDRSQLAFAERGADESRSPREALERPIRAGMQVVFA